MATMSVGDVMVPDVLTCWTIQHADAWAKAEGRGVYREDGRTWPPEYRWFRDQLRARTHASQGRFPVWATMDRPDLRSSGWRRHGERCVRVAFHVSRKQAMLVDTVGVFEVLNRQPFTWSKREDAAWERRVGGVLRWDLLTQAQQREVEDTWLRAFELRRPKGSHSWIGALEVDVLVAEVRMSDVVRVTPFVAR
ncbi:MAG: DUF3841 domain-containing protein [bacterium]|nr:DUF3841 domain-containing protein [bacterium]